MDKKWSRRSAGITALCAAVLMAVSGCAQPAQMQGSPSHPDAQEGQVTVRFLHIWDEHERAMENIVRAVEQADSDLRVEISTVDWSVVDREVLTASASDHMYDVFFQFAKSLGSMHEQGLLLELDPYINPGWEAGFQPGALDEYRLDGALYGIPFRGSGVVVVYNVDLFKRYGWRQPTSQEEMTALMQLAVNDGLIPLSAAGRPDGFQLETLRNMVTAYVTQAAGNLDHEDRLNGRRVDWQGELAMGAQLVKNWAGKGYFGPNPLSVDEETAMDNFLSGKAAMLLCNTNELYSLRSQDNYLNFQMDSFLFPGPEASDETLFANAWFQDGFAVWSGTEHPEQAAALLRGLTSREHCAAWAEETLSVMAIKDIPCEDEMLNEFNGYFELAGRYNVVPDYALGDSEAEKSQLFVSYLTSDMTADEYETNYENIVKETIRRAK